MLVRDLNIIANKFYDDHLRDSAGHDAVSLLRTAIDLCRRRGLARNTVLFLSQAEHDTFTNSVPILAWGNNTYRSNITIPVAVTLKMDGRVELTTNARFLYSMVLQQHQELVYHFVGLDGGQTTDLNLRKYRRVSGTRLFSDYKLGNTRGWKAQEELVEPTLTVNGQYTLVRLFDSTRPGLEGRNFYVATAVLLMAPSVPWFTYAGTHYEL
jgi:hypothetical protein